MRVKPSLRWAIGVSLFLHLIVLSCLDDGRPARLPLGARLSGQLAGSRDVTPQANPIAAKKASAPSSGALSRVRRRSTPSGGQNTEPAMFAQPMTESEAIRLRLLIASKLEARLLAGLAASPEVLLEAVWRAGGVPEIQGAGISAAVRTHLQASVIYALSLSSAGERPGRLSLVIADLAGDSTGG